MIDGVVPLLPVLSGIFMSLDRDTRRSVTHIVLNSGLWSPRYDNSEMPIQAADDHMNWLAAQLAGARVRGDRVVISSHIPPGKGDCRRGEGGPHVQYGRPKHCGVGE